MTTAIVLVYVGLGIIGWLGIWLLYSAVRYIPNDKVGIVEKLISRRGSIKSGFIALNGEAGFQPRVLRGGWHVMTPFIYRIHKMPLVAVPQGEIGYVYARDGVSLRDGQTLGDNSTAADFQDVVGFLANGGQKGPQRKILREGIYAVNLAQFAVMTQQRHYYLNLDSHDEKVFAAMHADIQNQQGFTPVVIQGQKDAIGIVTVHDGPSLTQGEIIAPIVGDDPKDEAAFHNNFQDPERFLVAGGRRGRQLQTLADGTYFINRLFATVEFIPKTVVEVGHVGVVISYTGSKGLDESGADYSHGEMVAQGSKGVWSVPLLPGKYAFNTYAGQIVMVPTTNIILKWIKNAQGEHKLDANLAEVSLITADAFEPSLPLSVVIHIDYRKAPLVIQRFGDVRQLVEQTLDPMVSAYFKNIGQTRTLIQLLQDRAAIQQTASTEMKRNFAAYNLELQEVLIGTPNAGGKDDGRIETILKQLRDRQIAREQVETYEHQKIAQAKARELNEEKARADQQTHLTESAIAVEIRENEGKATVRMAEQEAQRVRVLAEAEKGKRTLEAEGAANAVRAAGEAEADKTARIGLAQAMAIEEQVKAYGGPKYQLTEKVMTRFSQALEEGAIPIVPRVFIGGSDDNSKGGFSAVLESLFALMLDERLTGDGGGPAPVNPRAQALKEALRATVTAATAVPTRANGSAT